MDTRKKIIKISLLLFCITIIGEAAIIFSLQNFNPVQILLIIISTGLMQLGIGLLCIEKLILTPLENLFIDVKKIAQSGNGSETIRVEKLGEMRELAHNINTIIVTLQLSSKSLLKLNKELQTQRDTIEQEVDKRTKQLKEEQARFIASINSFPEAFIVTDTQGEILLTNKGLGTTLGIEIEKITMKDLENIFTQTFDIRRNIAICQSERKSLVLSGVPFKKKFLKIYIAPIFLGEGQIIGSVILIDDITEAVLTERSKDEFLTIASHELRTPLTAIKGNSNLLKQYYTNKVADPQFNEIIEDIEKASDSLINIVNSFLTTSRLEQNRLEFNKERVPIEPLVKEVIEKYEGIAQAKGLKLSYVNLNLPDISALCDKQRCEEVLTNLIGNALKYTDSGSIRVVIDKKEKQVKISVIDTGRGIPPKQQAFLFKKFQQTGNNIFTRDVSHGTGLGLYIAKLMVEAMNGEIYLEESVENKGSIFTFTLPIAN